MICRTKSSSPPAKTAPTARPATSRCATGNWPTFEHDYLRELLKRHQGDVRTAAREAKLPRGTLYRLMKKHGIDGASFR